jgi:hypothetical protein
MVGLVMPGMDFVFQKDKASVDWLSTLCTVVPCEKFEKPSHALCFIHFTYFDVEKYERYIEFSSRHV